MTKSMKAEIPSNIGAAIYDKQVAWKQHGQRKINKTIPKSVDSTYSQSKPEYVREIAAVASFSPKGQKNDDTAATENESNRMTTMHPTESQESSIQLHLGRQERAREHALEAQQKLFSAQPPKDFSKVTTCEPFTLSVGNRKSRRSTSESPTRDKTEENQLTSSTMTSKKSARKSPVQHSGDKSVLDRKESSWESERATLLSIIDSQRKELELREKAQQDAVQVAENFASAVHVFEERLVALETKTAEELTHVKQLLLKQTMATDLILHSLGISSPQMNFAPSTSLPTTDSSSFTH